jgi:hypothetical protein
MPTFSRATRHASKLPFDLAAAAADNGDSGCVLLLLASSTLLLAAPRLARC